MFLKLVYRIIFIAFALFLSNCITQFIPQVSEDKELLVVEGLITDKPDTNTIKLSRSNPLGARTVARPVTGCIVTISDDLGNTFNLLETVDGTYVTDPSIFRGVPGRHYKLHINTNGAYNSINYESYPVEMKPVPPIDSLFYEKETLKLNPDGTPSAEGCQIFLSTHDPANKTKFYKWDYSETWEFSLPYFVANKNCWVSNNSNSIIIKSTLDLTEDRIDRFPINFISNETDRLNEKYSILVNQYSLNEDEYFYWEKLQSVTQKVGTLYDITPASIPSNMYCIENPDETVLGYFSVSAVSSKRIFIKASFAGFINLYTSCNSDTIFDGEPIIYPEFTYWVVIVHIVPPPSYIVLTFIHGCADCTIRGKNTPPDFWTEAEKDSL